MYVVKERESAEVLYCVATTHVVGSARQLHARITKQATKNDCIEHKNGFSIIKRGRTEDLKYVIDSDNDIGRGWMSECRSV